MACKNVHGANNYDVKVVEWQNTSSPHDSGLKTLTFHAVGFEYSRVVPRLANLSTLQLRKAFGKANSMRLTVPSWRKMYIEKPDKITMVVPSVQWCRLDGS
jgi:hypothetical protein